jgi:hypothetical protein
MIRSEPPAKILNYAAFKKLAGEPVSRILYAAPLCSSVA